MLVGKAISIYLFAATTELAHVNRELKRFKIETARLEQRKQELISAAGK
jgi:hypothetical protein